MIIKTAERIKELREKNNLTQSELARRLNITRSSVNAWEMGISIPSTEKIVDLCLLLHTSSDYLLGLDYHEQVPVDKYNSDEKELIYHLIQYFDKNDSNN
ncbi:MAG: helix-turn-helix transcriptional regulator [Lachnospiraceae bacterium]|nr:helix-turn-helix transcriptional regulator [Lachnospiraceae bacterium]